MLTFSTFSNFPHTASSSRVFKNTPSAKQHYYAIPLYCIFLKAVLTVCIQADVVPTYTIPSSPQ